MINTEGKVILKHDNIYIDGILSLVKKPKFMYIQGIYCFVAYANSFYWRSDIGNRLLSKFPYIDFAGVFYADGTYPSTVFSLRSENKKMSVSTIAKMFGGGGHRNASGVRVNSITNMLPGWEFGSDLYDVIDNIYVEKTSVSDKLYNVVYCNCSTFKRELGRYLLQSKYHDGEKEIQEANDIMRIKNKNYEMLPRINVAAIWNYDGKNTSYTLVYDKSMTFGDIKNFNTKYGIKGINRNFEVLYDGLIKQLK